MPNSLQGSSGASKALEVEQLGPELSAVVRHLEARLDELRELLERPARRLYSPREAAVALGFSDYKVYQLIREGRLPYIQVLGQKRIDLDEAVAALRAMSTPEAAE